MNGADDGAFDGCRARDLLGLLLSSSLEPTYCPFSSQQLSQRAVVQLVTGGRPPFLRWTRL